jgi:adenine-specific DNA-methyltransferase
MARSRKSTAKPAAGKRPIEQNQYETHRPKNNPPVGLVTPDSGREAPKKQYAYDPLLDPTLTWAGKAEHTSFETPGPLAAGRRAGQGAEGAGVSTEVCRSRTSA